MSVRALLFDWDGTLVHHDGLQPGIGVAAVCETLAAAGFDVPSAEFEAAFARALPPYVPGETTTSPRIDALMVETLAALNVPADEALVDACCERFCAADCAGQRVFPDARGTLASLRYRGYRLAVISNTIFPARYFRARIAAARLTGYFDAIICSADIGFGKPHLAPYAAALQALDVKPAEALFIGDRADTDIVGAKAAGIPALHLIRDGSTDSQPARTIASLTELTAYLGEGLQSRT